MKFRLISSLLIGTSMFGITLMSCQHEPDFITGPYITTDCDPQTVYFISNTSPDIVSLIRSSCGTTGCHDNTSHEHNLVFTDYSGIKSFIDKEGHDELLEVIDETDPDKIMPRPPKPPLTPEMKQMLRTWIDQGMQNNRCESPDCDSMNVTYKGTIWPLVSTTCRGCHSGTAPDGGVRLETDADIQAIALNGYFLGVITGESGFKPMPYGGARLSQCKIDQIKKWINDGSPIQ